MSGPRTPKLMKMRRAAAWRAGFSPAAPALQFPAIPAVSPAPGFTVRGRDEINASVPFFESVSEIGIAAEPNFAGGLKPALQFPAVPAHRVGARRIRRIFPPRATLCV